MISVRLAVGMALVAVLAFGPVPTTEAGGTTRTVPTSPNCGTIQACVNASAAGDTITIKKGTYFENVAVPVGLVGLTVQGQLRFGRCSTPGAAVIDGSPGGVDGVGFDIDAPDVTIRCLTVQNGSTGIDVDADGFRADRLIVRGSEEDNLLISGANFVVENSRFLGSGDNGVDASGDNGRLTSNFARNHDEDCFLLSGTNLVVEGNEATVCEDENGFDISGAAPRVLRNKSDITDDSGFLIDCTADCANGLIQGNQASRAHFESEEEAFFITAASPGLRIEDNRAIDNSVGGFLLELDGAIVSGNRAERNGSSGGSEDQGFLIIGNDNQLTNNVAIGNHRDGFQIQGDNNTLTNNRADRNLKDGFDVESGTGNVLDGNFARDNRAEGIENNGTDTVLTDNSAGANRIDCANDGTIATNTNNFCSDGSNFNPPPEVESAPGRR